MVALRASRPAFLFPYTSQIHARSVAHTPFQTVSKGNSRKFQATYGPSGFLVTPSNRKNNSSGGCTSYRALASMCW
jgi:hypothetical protein